MIKVLINIVRILLSLTFIFSGFVKAVDPIGTQYKIQDYLAVWRLAEYVPDMVTLGMSVMLAMAEFVMGMFLLFAIYRRVVTKAMFLFLFFMTALTLWIYIANPVSDCGCFGDALVLTNGETLLKNAILLAMAFIVAWEPLEMPRFVSLGNQWMVFHYTFIFILGISVWSLYDLPIFDFRPYHIGQNIPKAMEIPEGAVLPEYETTFLLEKDGEIKEFTIDNYPDSTWTFVESYTEKVKDGFEPEIQDFPVDLPKGYMFLLVSPYLEKADDSTFGNIDIIYEYAHDHGYPFYCLTASGKKAQAYWRDVTGAEYPFVAADAIQLKTMVRSNPGLLLIKDGTIIGKWSHNSLPAEKFLEAPLEKSSLGQLQDNNIWARIWKLLLWFALPLTLLSIADRLWFWSRWLKEKERFEAK